jgi:PAS domain S-box-containing protein
MAKQRNYLLRFALATGLALLLVAGVVSVSSLRQTSRITSSIQDSYAVLLSLASVAAEVDQVVTITRVFVLTGSEEFLDPLEDLESRISDDLRRIEELIVGDPAQVQAFEELATAIDTRLAMSDEYIVIRSENEIEQAVELIPEGGERLASEIRDLTQAMTRVEEETLSFLESESDRIRATALYAVPLTLLFSLLLVGLSVSVLRKQISERNRVEEVSSSSQERLALVMRGTNDGIWDWNILTGERFVSRRLRELLGYEDEDLPDSSFALFDIVHHEHHPSLKKHLENHGPYSLELRILHRDGSYRWMLMRGDVQLDDTGETVRMVAAISDIAERKRAEEALKEKEDELRTITDNVAAFISYVDTDWRYRFVNMAHEEIWGVSAKEMVGRHIEDFLSEEIFENSKPHFETAFSGQKTSYRSLINPNEGSPHHTLVTLVPDCDTNGSVRGVFVVVADVNYLIQAEQALSESEGQNRMLVEGAPYCIHQMDLDGRLISMNPAGLSMMGFSSEEDVIGMSYYELPVEEDRERIAGLIHAAFKGQSSEFEFRFGDFVLSSWVVPVRDSSGEVCRLMGTTTDITERKRIEEHERELGRQLLQAQKLESLGTLVVPVKQSVT